MKNRTPPELDMTPEGLFRAPPRPPALPLTTRIGVVAILVAVLTGVIGAAALALWFALALIPVALVAAAIAWVAFRVQIWRLRRSGSLQRGVYRR